MKIWNIWALKYILSWRKQTFVASLGRYKCMEYYMIIIYIPYVTSLGRYKCIEYYIIITSKLISSQIAKRHQLLFWRHNRTLYDTGFPYLITFINRDYTFDIPMCTTQLKSSLLSKVQFPPFINEYLRFFGISSNISIL